MKKQLTHRLAIAHYNDGGGENNAEVFVHVDGADSVKEYMRLADKTYGKGHGITDITVYYLNDVQDARGKVYETSVKRV